MSDTAWLQWRAEGIGGSDVAAIMGLSPWASPYTVWLRKVGEVAESQPTEAMEMGKDMEPVIAKRFQRETGLYVAGEQTWCQHPLTYWARCTADGFVVEGPNSELADALGGFEAKLDGQSNQWDEIPVYYQCQAQWSMFVTERERWWFGVFHRGWRFRTYVLERDDADIALIVERCTKFWHEHVLLRVPPPVDGHRATTDSLKAIPADDGGALELDSEGEAMVLERDRLKEQEKALVEQIARVENWLRAELGPDTEGLRNGRLLISWRTQTKTIADVDALRADGLFEKYSKSTTSRVLRRHGTKEK